MENYESMVFYSSFFEGAKMIPDDMPELKVMFYEAILSYGLYGVEIELDWQLMIAWEQIKAQIDANNRRRENGQKGGLQKAKNLAKKNNAESEDVANCSKPVVNHSKGVANRSKSVANVNVNVNDNVNENEYAYDNGNGNDNGGAENSSAAAENSYAVSYYLEYINPSPSPSLLQSIESYIKEGMADDCLIAIFDYCRDNNKTSWAYIKSAVEGCFKDGIRTLEDYRRSREEREKARAGTAQKLHKSKFHNFEQREYFSTDFDDIYFAQLRQDSNLV